MKRKIISITFFANKLLPEFYYTQTTSILNGKISIKSNSCYLKTLLFQINQLLTVSLLRHEIPGQQRKDLMVIYHKVN